MNVGIDFIQLFLLALFNSFVIIGLHRASEFEYCHPDECGDAELCNEDCVERDSRMILWRLRHWAIQSLGKFWAKPFLTCPSCMASVHSTYVYWLFMPVNSGTILFWPLYILFLSGLVTLIHARIK